MASTETYYTDVSHIIQDGVVAKRLILDAKEYMQAVFNGKLVFNRALYHVGTPDFVLAVTPVGIDLKEFFGGNISYKTDFDGLKTEVDYTVSPKVILPNETEQDVVGTYTIEQAVSGLVVSGSYRQEADYISHYAYTDVAIISVMYSIASASGDEFLIPVASYSGKKIPVYASGKEGTAEAWGGSTSTFESVEGKILVSGIGVTFDPLTGKVYAPYLGTTPSVERPIAQMTALSIYVEEVGTLSWSGTAYAYQMANEKVTSYSTPSLAANYTDIGADGSAAMLTIKWTQTKSESYSSGAGPVETPLSGTISNSATSGNYIKSISGTSLLTGASLVTTSGSASRGNVTANSLAYTEKSRTMAYSVSVTVSINDKSASTSVSVYQAANVVSSYYTTPSITSVSATDVGANGSAASVSVVYTQSLVTTSTANPSGKSSEVGGTGTPTSITGSTVANSGAKSGVTVIANSWGTSVQSRQIVYKITALSIKSNNITANWSGTLNVYQQANAVVDTDYGAYTLSISPSASTIVSDGGSVTISASCLRAATYTYTSGSTRDVNLNADATIATSTGTLSGNSITGYGSAMLTIPENTGLARNITVTITAADGTTKQTATIAQDAVRYSFYSNTLAAIGASGGEMVLLIFSTRNDKAFPITASNIAVSGITGTSVAVAVSNSTTGEYKVTVSGIGANTSTSQRTFTVTATQPSSGKTFTWDATQSGASLIKGKVATILTAQFTDNSTYAGVSYTIYFDATDTTYYTGGTISNVYVQLNTKIDGTGDVIASTKIYDSLQVAAGSMSTTKLGTLNNSTGSSSIYVLVYYDNTLQFKTIPMAKPELEM